MLRDLFDFHGINWLTLAASMGFNFVLSLAAAFGGVFLDASYPDFYAQWGAAVGLLVLFLLCGLAGFVTGKLADTQALKHALWGSVGAVVPFVVVAVLFFNPVALLYAGGALAGAFNGGLLSLPRRRHYQPPQES